MISKAHKEAYVWIWLPKVTSPIVAGKLEASDGIIRFNYGKSYLERQQDKQNPAIAIYDDELPLKSGILPLRDGLSMPSCIRDGSPDAWGRRVIINRSTIQDRYELDEMTYLLESGSDRVGALDFQASPGEYVPRSPQNAKLEDLLESASRVERGIPLSQELDQALFHGSSIGGARPKAQLEDGEHKYIAKFSLSSDTYNVVKAEFIAMRLAARVGLSVAPVRLEKASGKDVILIERFDREKSEDGWRRKAMLSALTLFGLDEMMACYASYEKLAEMIRHQFSHPKETLKELYSRLVFNILTGNTDDHARNHAAFWDGEVLSLTPAYDICPQERAGNEATQAMLINGDDRMSCISSCISAAHNFLLSKDDALAIFEKQKQIIEFHWQDVCEEAQLSEVDKNLLWGRQFLNPFSLYGI